MLAIPKPLFALLAGLALLYSILPLTAVRLPNWIEILFALVGLYTLFRFGSGLRWSSPVKLMVASIVVLTLSWVFMLRDHPDLARSGPSLEDFLDKFFFLFISIVLAGRVRNVLVYLSLIGLFIIAMPWLSGDGFEELVQGLHGQRANFGINPIRTGILYGVVFLGLCCFAGKFFLNGRFSPLRFCMWLMLLIFTLMAIVITQSRTAMVALVPALFIGMVYLFAVVRLSWAGKLQLAVVLAFVSLLAIIASYQVGLLALVTDRFESESVVVADLMSGDLSDIPKTSWGLRVHFLIEGSKGITERPWTGWGYRAGELILDQEGLLKGNSDAFSQVHNGYYEAALRYGVGGVIIVFLLFAWGFRGLWNARQAGLVEPDMFGFLIVTLVFFMVTNLFDGILFQTEGVLLFNMLMGVTASFIFLNRCQRQKVRTDSDDHTA
ncbi:O-antigen ligase [Marinobacter sp. 1_MG-2023]|uniref:O-antigen ligase family protein n=1 Tax=Marinobacter sp. 1_MG-2023 TaxID=3062627 RepID=UPI0026E48DF5|nr:O-antigen ligase family protein [Marinobacter sp. 1_MG-2023]MDO6825236.1 O-antigen ligase family protein [Marinobacter sp. 1_MG-2023]